METHLGRGADPNGALGKIAKLANTWEARARRAEARGRAVSLAWFSVGVVAGVVGAWLGG